MEIFINLKKYLAFLGIKPDGKSNFNLQNIVIVFLFTCCLVGMSAFFLLEAKSMIESSNSLYGAACSALGIFTFSSSVVKRSKIFELISRFEEIIKKQLSNRAKMYEKVNEKIEKCTKIVYVSLVQVNLVVIFTPKLLASYWFYYGSGLGSDAFQQLFSMSMPFNWKTPIGYAITMSIQIGTWAYMLILSCFILCFLGGVCWLLIAIIEYIGLDFQRLAETSENSAKLKTKLCEIIQFHSTAKQLVYDFSEIYEIIITGYYLWGVSMIGCTLFTLHLEMTKGTVDPIGLPFALVGMFWAFVHMFIFSDFGENMSNHFSEVDNMIYDCDWYAFPKEIQRIIPIITISAQELVTLTGFANLLCMRDTFKKVVNGGFSYFMMIRRIYH